MPTSDALMGTGLPAQVAQQLGGNPHSLTCTGTAQGTAAKVLSKQTELLTASSQTGAIFPSDAPIGSQYMFFNKNSDSAVVYVPSGHYLNGSQNAGLTIAQNKGAIMWQYKKSYWTCVILA